MRYFWVPHRKSDFFFFIKTNLDISFCFEIFIIVTVFVVLFYFLLFRKVFLFFQPCELVIREFFPLLESFSSRAKKRRGQYLGLKFFQKSLNALFITAKPSIRMVFYFNLVCVPQGRIVDEKLVDSLLKRLSFIDGNIELGSEELYSVVVGCCYQKNHK